MPYDNLEDGLYLLKQRSRFKIADHYGVLDVGNRLNIWLHGANHPVVVHQLPPAIALSWLQDTGDWEVIGQVSNEAEALIRMRAALTNPKYDLFGNNCEHFARFVTTGRFESTQLRTAAVIAGLAALVYASENSEA